MVQPSFSSASHQPTPAYTTAWFCRATKAYLSRGGKNDSVSGFAPCLRVHTFECSHSMMTCCMLKQSWRFFFWFSGIKHCPKKCNGSSGEILKIASASFLALVSRSVMTFAISRGVNPGAKLPAVGRGAGVVELKETAWCKSDILKWLVWHALCCTLFRWKICYADWYNQRHNQPNPQPYPQSLDLCVISASLLRLDMICSCMFVSSKESSSYHSALTDFSWDMQCHITKGSDSCASDTSLDYLCCICQKLNRRVGAGTGLESA